MSKNSDYVSLYAIGSVYYSYVALFVDMPLTFNTQPPTFDTTTGNFQTTGNFCLKLNNIFFIS